ncbi:FAD-binding and (Fe-S)-binding domain-containing protein [Altibacter sp.]|uniref:FAD-binding and (Fe-S)-binding domain-containing protein n=1 Tax=Altibacter sp. TaxID=2024823 RepID=UPI002585B4C8|nr:FAD-binding and (Fe-S)-binding domain-containing protein [Altibacter sp.]MCW9038186.1 FAD-binding protein [Altibacter sp.]
MEWESFLHQLSNQLEGDLLWDELHRSIYATDASVYRKIPIAVAFPRTVQDIQCLVRFATEYKTSLIPRTAGTSLAGQCVGEGIVVDVSKYFTKIIAVDIKAKSVTIQPGVIRDDLNRFLEPYGLFFGPNTSTSNRCMIGGMVGNNSSGTTSIQYGVTRDKVLKLSTVLSNGDLAEFGLLSKSEFLQKAQSETFEGSLYKMLLAELSSEEAQKEIKKEFPKPEIHRRNTGYAVDALLDSEVFSTSEAPVNLCSLLCGSEGTLAITTEIVLQLDELPPIHSAMVVAHYETLGNCLNDVNKVMEHNLFSCEMMDDIILNCTKKNKKYEAYRFFVEGAPKTLLLLELRSHDPAELSLQTDALLQSLQQSAQSYSAPVLRGEEIDMAMELRKAGLGLLGNMVGDAKAVACIEDTAVALTDLPAFIGEFSDLMARYDQNAVYYAHAGAGELHLRPILNLKEARDVTFFRKITTDVAMLTKKYKGSFSGEHGDGIVRAEFLPMLIGSKNYRLLQRIKQTFDPCSILNPGKIVDACKMDESLRYEVNRKEPEVVTKINFEDSGGILRLAEKCNGSGDCRKPATAGGTMCPSYHATLNEKDTTRARANALREVLTNPKNANAFNSDVLKEVFDLCISCKACSSECPSNVDMATAKIEFLYQYQKVHGITPSNKRFGKSSFYNKQAARIPGVSNWIFGHAWLSKQIKKWNGIAPQRKLPRISSKSFSKLYKSINNQTSTGYSVLLFVDEFSNYLESQIAVDAYELLIGLGYKVTVVDHLDSARALLSKGMLEEAKIQVDKNITFLKDLVAESTPLLGIEPSAILGFRDEYLRLTTDLPSAERITKHTFLIEEFLASEIAKGTITAKQFTSEAKKIKIHVHCHQKALSNQKVTFDLLNLPVNYNPTIIPSGCCGMAGSFGYEKEHYDLSMQIGELKLFPVLRKASQDTIIAANGTSCRHQIEDGTAKKALHPVSILRHALLPSDQIGNAL